MKVKSKKMLQFLAETGVLDSPDEVIINQAKIEYRRRYKKEFRTSCKKNRALRPSFTGAEFEGIKERAKLFGIPPTTYAREIIINAQENTYLIPKKDDLLKILQSISMAEIAFNKDINIAEAKILLLNAETMLLSYLNIK